MNIDNLISGLQTNKTTPEHRNIELLQVFLLVCWAAVFLLLSVLCSIYVLQFIDIHIKQYLSA